MCTHFRRMPPAPLRDTFAPKLSAETPCPPQLLCIECPAGLGGQGAGGGVHPLAPHQFGDGFSECAPSLACWCGGREGRGPGCAQCSVYRTGGGVGYEGMCT